MRPTAHARMRCDSDERVEVDARRRAHAVQLATRTVVEDSGAHCVDARTSVCTSGIRPCSKSSRAKDGRGGRFKLMRPDPGGRPPARIATLFLRGPGQFLKIKWRITLRSRPGQGLATLAGPCWLPCPAQGQRPTPPHGESPPARQPSLGGCALVRGHAGGRRNRTPPRGPGAPAAGRRAGGGAAPPAPRPSQPLLARGA
jgi:hypothetical protein